MSSLRLYLISGLGIVAGGLIAVQSVLNASLGQRTGYLGSGLILTFISALTLLVLILIFPSTADFRDLPGFSEWYLYVGGILGVAIIAIPIFLSQLYFCLEPSFTVSPAPPSAGSNSPARPPIHWQPG